MSVSQFLSYVSSLVPVNGEIVIRNVKLTSGNFSTSNNCLSNLPSGCNKVVFENFDTSISIVLQYMFYKNDTTETNLEVVMDLKSININYALYSMFWNN